MLEGMAKSKDEPLLTYKQEAYCQHAAVTSYSEAYKTVYQPKSGYNFHEDIRRLNRLPHIARRIREIMAETNEAIGVTREWLLRWWFYRMIYDPAELTAWAVGACHYCYGEGHQYQWRIHEYLEAIREAEQTKNAPVPDVGGGFGYDATRPPVDDCPHCHGKGIGRAHIADTSTLSPMARAAFDGIKETRQGIEIKMADKDVAAANFAKLSGFDIQQVRIMGEKLPEEETLAAMATDPLAAAAAYKRMVGTMH